MRLKSLTLQDKLKVVAQYDAGTLNFSLTSPCDINPRPVIRFSESRIEWLGADVFLGGVGEICPINHKNANLEARNSAITS